MPLRISFFTTVVISIDAISPCGAAEPWKPERFDMSQWAMPESAGDLIKGRAACAPDGKVASYGLRVVMPAD